MSDLAKGTQDTADGVSAGKNPPIASSYIDCVKIMADNGAE